MKDNKTKEFFDYESTRMNLDNSLCMYDGEPCFVSVPERYKGSVKIYRYSKRDNIDGGWTVVMINDHKFDYRSINLGYYYHSKTKTTYYLTRVPGRQNKQGLGVENIYSNGERSVFRYNEDLVPTQDIINCVMNKHVPFNKAIDMLNDGDAKLVPIDRYIAIGIEGDRYSLHIRGKREGFSRNLDLPVRFEWLNSRSRSVIEMMLNNLGVLL